MVAATELSLQFAFYSLTVAACVIHSDEAERISKLSIFSKLKQPSVKPLSDPESRFRSQGYPYGNPEESTLDGSHLQST